MMVSIPAYWRIVFNGSYSHKYEQNRRDPNPSHFSLTALQMFVDMLDAQLELRKPKIFGLNKFHFGRNRCSLGEMSNSVLEDTVSK
mgnify:CR=1 FL=1